MINVIQRSVTFRAVPAVLFELYLDAEKHSLVTGSKAVISKLPGRRFTAFDGVLSGRNLLIVPRRMIVQSWRSRSWKKTDADSVLMLFFSKIPSGGCVDLVHVNVPDHDYKGVSEGWEKYYWQPWREYLQRKLD
ncbi:MAG: SRPBCC domain-containing protein [Betaproteobacteria bacterium]|nr:SRPBCC domain-containing protein [Betaproteobacteria bacterium]